MLPTVRTPGPFPNEVESQKNTDKLQEHGMAEEYKKPDMTLRLVVAFFLIVTAVLAVSLVVLSFKLVAAQSSKVEDKCEMNILSEMECYDCGKFGIPGVEHLMRSSNDVCCTPKKELIPIREKVTFNQTL